MGGSVSYTHLGLNAYISEAIRRGRKIHFLPPYRAENKMWLEQLTGISSLRIGEYASVELIRAVVDLRSVKEHVEIEMCIRDR